METNGKMSSEMARNKVPLLLKSTNLKLLQPQDFILIHVPIHNLGQTKKTLVDFI